MHCNALTLSQNAINVLGKYLCFELCYHTGPNRWLGEQIANSAEDLKKFLNKEITKVSQWFFDNEVLAHQQKNVYMIFFANKNTQPLSLYLNGHKLDYQDRKNSPDCLSNIGQIWEKVSKNIINIHS